MPVTYYMDGGKMSETLSFLSNKTEHDLLVILEGFCMLLSDEERFDDLAEFLDLSNEHLMAIRDDVAKFMNFVV